MWFAFKLVSLNHWKQRYDEYKTPLDVVICFQISIFEPLETAAKVSASLSFWLWFAFKLVSLNHWKQRDRFENDIQIVVICFQISIFEPLETAIKKQRSKIEVLWFAFKLVSLNHWKQLNSDGTFIPSVVICFQISIFEPLETAPEYQEMN